MPSTFSLHRHSPTTSASSPSSYSFFLQKPSTSSSSSPAASAAAASSSYVSALKSESGGGCEQSPRRLTRQRKLRHLDKQDLGLDLPEKSRSSPTSPEYSTRKSKSPGPGSKSNHWSSSPAATPQPLPLPESSVIRGPDSGPKDGNKSPAFFGKKQNQVPTTSAVASHNSHSGNRRETVSKDVNNGGRSNVTSGLRILNIFPRTKQANAISSHPLSPQKSNNVDGFPTQELAPESYNFRCKNTVATTSAINGSSNFHKAMPRESCNVSKSAPTSPAVSPRRSNAGDPFLFYGTPHDQYQDPFASRLSPVIPAHSPGHSPLQSPTCRSPRLYHKSVNGNGFPSHHRSFTESSSDRAESISQVNAHPLPLPPGAKASKLYNAEITSISSMKGQWQRGKLIGRGTFGSVYLGTNRETGALCAMKEVDLIPDDPKSAECIKQLEQEIKLLRTLKHPNIVQYYGSEVIDDHFYIYLEYVHPGSIDKYVKDHIGAMTESVVRNFTRHILNGLAYLHSTKTIHRDIKGANLLVDSSGVVKLADFGMAKILNGQSYNLSLKGSPYWMAPEVIKAAMQNNSDPDLALAVDIWSLGCTIVEMFNGKPPWSDFTGPQAMFKVLNTIPDIPETLSADGKDFLSRCFRREPGMRPLATMLLDHPFVRNSHVRPFHS